MTGARHLDPFSELRSTHQLLDNVAGICVSSSFEICVTSVHKGSFGGLILIGRDEAGVLRRAILRSDLSAREPSVGESWRLTGKELLHPVFGPQLEADIALPLIPKGDAIIRYLATDKRFAGIGWATATLLWNVLGEDIYTHLQDRNLSSIAAIVGPQRAIAIVDGFGLLADEVAVFRWLDRYGVSPRVAGAVVSIWGRQAIERIEQDPYALTLLEPWAEVDARALRLGVSIDDSKRLHAAVEEALAVCFRQGHMAAPYSSISASVARFLLPWQGDPQKAMNSAIEAGRIFAINGGLLQSRACWFMENEFEQFLHERLTRERHYADSGLIAGAISEVEAEAGHRLNESQRAAVFMVASNRISIITGAAGTGKTTVLKAVLRASESCQVTSSTSRPDHQLVALAGRAARRMAQATGREGKTIARFLYQMEHNIGQQIRRGMVIFDEASMLDTPTLYRILSQISNEVDLVFIGDPAQLPPIGPGDPFRAMLAAERIPRVALDVVHRQHQKTGIPRTSRKIREGAPPQFARFDKASPRAPGVFLVSADYDEIGIKTLDVFRAMCGPAPNIGQMDGLHALDVQILCLTKNGPAGTKRLNGCIDTEYAAQQPRIGDWGLSVGSKVLWLKNDYRKAPIRDRRGSLVIDNFTNEPTYTGFMNGAIGVIKGHHSDGAWVVFDDGAEDAITATDLDKLTLGWAISVHKAQGSQFRHVIVPIFRSRLLDRNLIYTAVTRASESVVLIGDPHVISSAIESPPKATSRFSKVLFDSRPQVD